MPPPELPASPLEALRTVEITQELEPQLQRFFDANPEYFLAVFGEPAGPGEAHEAIHGEHLTGWSFTKKWLIGYMDERNSMVAVASVISDLLARSVWHMNLYIVETSRHGTGDAQALYQGIEDWAASNGAAWLRLGVVQGNVRAERFWESLGYIQARTRGGIEMGKLTNTVRVMVKPLGGGSLADYLSLVERDRPEPQSSL